MHAVTTLGSIENARVLMAQNVQPPDLTPLRGQVEEILRGVDGLLTMRYLEFQKQPLRALREQVHLMLQSLS